MNRIDEVVLLERAYERLPLDVFWYMVTFIRPKQPPRYPAGLQRQLEALQRSPKQTPMGLYGLEDFVLSPHNAESPPRPLGATRSRFQR
jgi:hypothetical protein